MRKNKSTPCYLEYTDDPRTYIGICRKCRHFLLEEYTWYGLFCTLRHEEQVNFMNEAERLDIKVDGRRVGFSVIRTIRKSNYDCKYFEKE